LSIGSHFFASVKGQALIPEHIPVRNAHYTFGTTSPDGASARTKGNNGGKLR
jgi:hypothetical protein